MQNLPPDNVIRVDFSRGKKLPLDGAIPASMTNPKRSSFEELLQAGIASVSFDPRRNGVKVPGRFQKNSSLILNFSYGYRIDDFYFDDTKVSATLMFPEGQFYCVIPWSSVFALHSEELQKSIYWDEETSSQKSLTLVLDDQNETEENPK